MVVRSLPWSPHSPLPESLSSERGGKENYYRINLNRRAPVTLLTDIMDNTIITSHKETCKFVFT